MAVFVDVVRAGSFSAAARDRAVTPSAIVRQINTLEQELGVPLLIRSTRSLTMTDAGQSLFERAKRLLDDLADTHAEVSAFHGLVTGTLRVACFPTFGKRYVLPVLAELQAGYPSLKVELDLNEKLGDPVLERLDAVIRMGGVPDSTLIATKLAPLNRVLAASPAYLGRAGVPGNVAELAAHRLLDKLHGADLLGWSDVLGRPAAEVSNDPVAALLVFWGSCPAAPGAGPDTPWIRSVGPFPGAFPLALGGVSPHGLSPRRGQAWRKVRVRQGLGFSRPGLILPPSDLSWTSGHSRCIVEKNDASRRHIPEATHHGLLD